MAGHPFGCERFGFLFSAAVGAIASELFEPPRASSMQGLASGAYAALYVSFVYVHVKRTEGDCVLQPSLLKAVIVFCGLMTLVVAGGDLVPKRSCAPRWLD